MTVAKPIYCRLAVEENMTVDYVKQHGNAVQKTAICIFDEDGNGVFDKHEAEKFNSTRLTLSGDTLRINKAKSAKGENPLVETVDLKKAQADYAIKQEVYANRKKVVRYEKSPYDSKDIHRFYGYDKNGNVISFREYNNSVPHIGFYKIEEARFFDENGHETKRIEIVDNKKISIHIVK